MSAENSPRENKKPLNETMTPEEYKKLQDTLIKIVEKVTSDPKILEESEEFARKARRRGKFWFTPFDI